MKKKLYGSTVVLLSVTSIIITSILVIIVGNNALLDKLNISLIILSIMLFVFLFYGLYKGYYLQNDINYKLNIRDGYNFALKGLRKIRNSSDFDFSCDIDIPIVNIILGIISFIMFLIMLVLVFCGISLLIYGSVILIIFVVYYVLYKAYRRALFSSQKTIGNCKRSFFTALLYTFIYIGWIVVALQIAKMILKNLLCVDSK